MITHTVLVADLKRAIEGRDAKALAGFYADNALMRIIDRDNPPSKPRVLEGKAAISAYYDDAAAARCRIASKQASATARNSPSPRLVRTPTEPRFSVRPCWSSGTAGSPARQQSKSGTNSGRWHRSDEVIQEQALLLRSGRRSYKSG